MAGAIEATGPNIRQTRKCLHYYIICVHYFIRLSGRPETDWVLPEPDQHRKSKSSFRFRFTGTGFSDILCVGSFLKFDAFWASQQAYHLGGGS